MKILKRIFFGILFTPTLLLTMFIVAPIWWLAKGNFIYPIDVVIDFYLEL